MQCKVFFRLTEIPTACCIQAMYPPFEFNNWLGPLLALACFGKMFLLLAVLKVQERFFSEEEASWRRRG